MSDNFEPDDVLEVIDLPRNDVLERHTVVLSVQTLLERCLFRLHRMRTIVFSLMLIVLVVVFLSILVSEPAARILLFAIRQPTPSAFQEAQDFSAAAEACALHLVVRGDPPSFDGPMNQSRVRGTLQRIEMVTCAGPNPFNPPPHPHHMH